MISLIEKMMVHGCTFRMHGCSTLSTVTKLLIPTITVPHQKPKKTPLVNRELTLRELLTLRHAREQNRRGAPLYVQLSATVALFLLIVFRGLLLKGVHPTFVQMVWGPRRRRRKRRSSEVRSTTRRSIFQDFSCRRS